MIFVVKKVEQMTALFAIRFEFNGITSQNISSVLFVDVIQKTITCKYTMGGEGDKHPFSLRGL